MTERRIAERTEPTPKVSAQRMRLWHAVNDFCRQHGGAVVSVPGHKEMRIEIPKSPRSRPSWSSLAISPDIVA